MTELLRFNTASRRSDWGLLAVALSAVMLLLIGGNLAANGFDVRAGLPASVLPGWDQGSLLQVLLIWISSWFLGVLDPISGLLLLYVLMGAFCAGTLMRNLRVSNWPVWQAVLAVLLAAAHPVVLYAFTTAHREVLLCLAVALLVPSRRRLEAIGDVEAVLNFGLVLIMLLLSGPALSALVPFLVLAVPLRDREARHDPRAFLSLLLIGAAPVLIVLVGIIAIWLHSGLSLAALAAPYWSAFQPGSVRMLPSLLLMAICAPIWVVVVLHMIVPDRRRQLRTSILALFIPIYLMLGRGLLEFTFADWTPALVLYAASLSWLGATRVRSWMRVLVLIVLAIGAVLGWVLAPLWADPAWLNALMPVHLFSYRLG